MLTDPGTRGGRRSVEVGMVQRVNRMRWLALITVLLATLVSSCTNEPRRSLHPTTTQPPTTAAAPTVTRPATTAPTTVTPPRVAPSFVDATGFNDHTVPRIRSTADFTALAHGNDTGQASVKFVIPRLLDPAGDATFDNSPVRWADGNFYKLHDEWYWYRLLNGHRVPGISTLPIDGPRLDTVQEIYTWAEKQSRAELPLDLSWVKQDSDNRLYSPYFYQVALNSTRTYGIGSLVRFPDRKPGVPAHWLIELEYVDSVSPSEVAAYFERLHATLPSEIGNNLEWVVRSPEQEASAREMVDAQLPFHDRVVHFSDLVAPGTVSVYSQGITAGRLLYVGEGGEQLSDSTTGDILVTERVPDWLPPASALITSDPQTPLAHVSLLARNRGIPNASLSGVHLNAGLRQAASARAYALVAATVSPSAEKTLRVILITPEQFNEWRQQRTPPPTNVDEIPTDIPLVVDLTTVAQTNSTAEAIDRQRPILGGKSTGFLSLLSTPGLTPPPTPVAITVRPYLEHIASLEPIIVAAISDPAFVSSTRARWLVLEGPKDFATMFPSPADEEFAESFQREQTGTVLGRLLEARGLRQMVEDRPVNQRTLNEITSELTQTFGSYATDAGLRFRSSSSVEDIEGFNGAGLYTSYTGYLNAKQLGGELQDKTIERALSKAWASYWGFEAFQERSQENINHLSGAMGLTVHARFDDEFERNNGVATFTFLPGGSPSDALLDVNVQQGSVDVTNPDPKRNDLPEVIRVHRKNELVTIERVSGSTIALEGRVLSDNEAKELFTQTAAVAARWRARENESLSKDRRVQTVVLDFEFKTMKLGWPRLAAGAKPFPPRLVIRQVRSLEPGMRSLPAAVRALPVPLDVLRRSSKIEIVHCDSTDTVVVLTDPLRAPDMGYAVIPFIRRITGQSKDSPCTRETLYESSGEYLKSLASQSNALALIDGKNP